jgi:hypothetical protein
MTNAIKHCHDALSIVQARRIEIPDWLRRMPANACLNSAEVARVFGVQRNTLYCAVSEGKFPAPDFKAPGLGIHQITKPQWRASTVRNEIKRRREVAARILEEATA